MGYGKLAEAIELMSDLDLLKYVLPEIEELKNVTQSPEHHFEGDTYIHTLSVLRKAENGIIPQLVALLHDVGKKKAKTIDESGKMSFLKHEDYSAEIAEEILTRLKFDRDLIDIVKHIVKNHMRAHFCKEWSTGAIRRFVREAGSNLDYILNLTQIDNLSSLTLSGEPKKDYIEDLRERIKTVTLIPISKKPILDGLEIMDTLKIPPSKRVGEIGKLLLDLEDEYASSNKILTKEDAFIFLKNIP